jgi:hypothetical protein
MLLLAPPEFQNLYKHAVATHLASAMRAFWRLAHMRPQTVLNELHLHEAWRQRQRLRRQHAVLPDETAFLDDTPLLGTLLYTDGSQPLNENTWGRRDGGLATIVCWDGNPYGRLWGRLQAFGEPHGFALLASNNSTELGAVGAALSILVACERYCGPPRPPAIYDDLQPLDVTPSDEALLLWSRFGERIATVVYDSTHGIGIAMGRIAIRAEQPGRPAGG